MRAGAAVEERWPLHQILTQTVLRQTYTGPIAADG
jgi:hypothetical protein